MNYEFKRLDALGQFVVLVSAIVGFFGTVLNLSCVLKVICQKSFCLTSTASQIMMISLFGSNILTGATTITKEALFIFLGPNLPRYWLHFESYIVTFCLISSSVHILLIVVTYLVNSFHDNPQVLRSRGRIICTLLVGFAWVVSLSPAAVKTDRHGYARFLNIVSLMLLTITCLQIPLLFMVLKCTWRTKHGGTKSSNDQCNNVKSNLTNTRLLRLQLQEKALCVSFMASYLLCSFPYMIYYPVLSTVYVGTHHKADVVDDILFLFILGKCFCDALIFIVRKGWRTKVKRKVNFQLQEKTPLTSKTEDTPTQSAHTNV